MPDAVPSRPTADRNLLFGILALQMDFITRDALIAAMHAWVLDKSRPLGAILVAQGALQSAKGELLEPLVAAHLEMHGGDVEKSLAAVHVSPPLREQLQSLADPDVQASLAQLPTPPRRDDSWATRSTTAEQPYSAALRYHVLRPHGKGGLGEVFVAHDQELNRRVALKEIQDKHADDPQSRGRFLREAEITGGLEHPGIVPVYGLGQYVDGRPYYAMRFVQGETLKEAITHYHRAADPHRPEDAGRLPELELRALLTRFVAVCNAIAYAHSRGVIHRDIKPSNVMLGKFGETLVVDWGLAKAVGSGQQGAGNKDKDEPLLVPRSGEGAAVTHMGAALGTPAYMSPEQAAGRLDQLGPASDIYSLGATLYTILTGRPSIDSKDVVEALSKVQRGEWPPPRQVKSDVPRALEAICLKAMALRTGDRYGTALDIARDVERWLADEPVSTWPESWPLRARRWGRRHRTFMTSALVAIGVAFIALTVGLVFLAAAEEEQAKARKKAETNEKEAQEQTALAEERLKLARHSLYDSQMAEVAAKWSSDPSAALALLDDPRRCPEDLRDYTWRFYHRMCRRDHIRWTAHQKRVIFVQFTPDGKTLISAGHDGKVLIWDWPTQQLQLSIGGESREQVTAAALSPDGKRLVTGDSGGHVKMWNVAEGRELGTFAGHNAQILDVALSTDGKHVAASSAGTLLVWDISGKRLSHHRGAAENFWTLAFRPDGRMLVAGGAGGDGKLMAGTLKLFSGTDFSEVIQSPDFENSGGFTSLTFAGDSMTLLAATNFGRLLSLHLGTFHVVPQLQTQGETMTALALTHDGRMVVTSALFGLRVRAGLPPRAAPEEDRRLPTSGPREMTFTQVAATAHYRAVRLWEAGSLQPRSYLHGVDTDVFALALSPDDRLLATGDDKGDITIWNIATPLEYGTLHAEGQEISRMSFAADGRTLLGGSSKLFLWDPKTGRELPSPGRIPQGTSVVSSDHRRLLVPTQGQPGGLEVWDLCAGRLLHTLERSDSAHDMIFSADSRLVAGLLKEGERTNVVRLWEAETGRCLRDLQESADIAALVFAPEGSILVGSVKKEKNYSALRFWDVPTGRRLLDCEQSAGIYRPEFSPDGQLLASGAEGEKHPLVKVWDVATGKLSQVLSGLELYPRDLHFAPDSKSLVAVGNEFMKRSQVRQWDLATGRLVASLDDPLPDVQSTAVAADGALLAIGGGSMQADARGEAYGEIILWDLAARRERARLRGHRSVVWSLAFSPDGKTLASGGFDYLAKLWNATTGQELATLEGHKSTVLCVAFAPDGKTLATGSYDHTIKLWAAPPPTVTLPPWTQHDKEALSEDLISGREDRGWADGLGKLSRLREQLDRKREAADQNTSKLARLVELADGYTSLATIQAGMRQSGTAAATLSQALPLRRRLAEAEPKNEEGQVQLGDCLGNLGDLQRMIGDSESALENGREALEIRKKLVQAMPDDLDRQSKLGGSYNNVAMALQTLGKPKEALSHLEKALEHQRRAFDAKPNVAQYRRFLSNHYINLSKVRRDLKQPAEAVEAVLAFKHLSPNDPAMLYVAAQELSQCLSLVGQDPPERKKYTDMALQTLREAQAAGFPLGQYLLRDAAFLPLRNEAEFKVLLPRDASGSRAK
jgi:WD40 repeat protein/serine/threonine protein kinase/tetratricopeptide (TPR) repeat protein